MGVVGLRRDVFRGEGDCSIDIEGPAAVEGEGHRGLE
jgi:hypothetical protein